MEKKVGVYHHKSVGCRSVMIASHQSAVQRENRAGRTTKPEEANFQIVERRLQPQQAMACRMSFCSCSFSWTTGKSALSRHRHRHHRAMDPSMLTASSADFRDLPAV